MTITLPTISKREAIQMALVATIVFIGIIIALHFNNQFNGATGSPTPTGAKPLSITQCKYDDGEFDRSKYDGCYWDAAGRTNGQGFSFIALDNPADSSGEPILLYADDYSGPDPKAYDSSSGYNPKDEYLGESDDWNKSPDTQAKEQGDSPNGPEYNSKETDYFNTYNEQYKNWHHEGSN